jgi:DNA-binding XRE family transcriptional regulator/NACalpha-BTF3-like transcription factor
MIPTDADDAEAQMRQALGVDGRARTSRADQVPVLQSSASSQLTLQGSKHRFVRDGEVPVTMTRRDHRPDVVAHAGAAPASNNVLEATRQAMRSETLAKERAERALADAQDTIRRLETQLAHERIAKGEALLVAQQAATERDEAREALRAAEAALPAKRAAQRPATSKFARADTVEVAEPMSLSAQLHAARIQCGLSVAEVADRVGVSIASVYFWENGRVRPRAGNLAALCKVLQVPMHATHRLVDV